MVYRLFRKLYVAIWYYFLPFIVLLIMYFKPVYDTTYGEKIKE